MTIPFRLWSSLFPFQDRLEALGVKLIANMVGYALDREVSPNRREISNSKAKFVELPFERGDRNSKCFFCDV